MKYTIVAAVIVVVLVLLSRLLGRKPPSPPKAESQRNTGTKPALRQFRDLRPEDFEKHPIWVHCHVIDYNEPWYGETNEETFRPWLKGGPVDPRETMFLVAASLRLADGTELPGFITPQNPAENKGEPDLGIIQPQVFLPSGKRVAFWFGIMTPRDDHIAGVYAALGKTAAEVFPVSFAAKEGLATGITSGSIPGFCSRRLGKGVVVTK